MLQLLRGKKSSLLVKIVLGLVVIGFSFFGIESYFVANIDTSVARVGKGEISQEQFRERFAQYRQRMVQMMGEGGDASFLDRPEIKLQLLNSMVDERVLLDANDKLGIAISPDRIRSEILAIGAFQNDGKFDPDQYRMLLSSQGMTPAGFEQRVRDDLAVRELPQQVNATALVTDAEIDTYLRLKDQRRDFHYAKLPKPVAKPDAEVSDADIESYYKEHASEYMTPERVALDYVELDAAGVHVDETPDDSVLKDRYEKEKARYVTAEQRLASHILVKVGGKGGPDDQKAALAKAEDIESQIKSGKSFADLAKKESDDLGSKNSGGDLGWLDKGSTDEAFETALFALQKDEVSKPVLSSEGYHIIELRDVRPGKTRPFEEVRADLAKEYAETEKERVYAEKAGRLTDLVFQNPASLEPAVKELGLKVGKTALFPRMGGDGIAANPGVVKAAFSDSVLVQNNNSDPIEIGPNHVVVVRIAEHKPAEPIPLETVKLSVRSRILAERLSKEAKDQADALFAELGKGETLEQLAGKHDLKIEEQKGIGREAAVPEGTLVQAVFAMPRPAEGKSEFKLVDMAGDEYALVRLDAVVDGDPSKLDAKTREATRNTLTESLGSVTTREFVSALRKNTRVTLSEKRLEE
ncbi:SurA N-terminal domain-containing protein [Dokdonella sp.]|uniref:SurA N-terminal domain-containing protein n=1 Tax=Dokdonella sp. TaxID=2291710 RepID=UPI0026115A26|nr:SurA N-terminal domain-containing protein [Dokdonella sp.]